MTMKLHSKEKGILGELTIAADLVSKGYSVFTELGDNSKVDLIAIDKNYNCIKVQVKCFSARKEAVIIKNSKSGPNYSFKYQAMHFDVCAVFVSNYNKILYISSKELLNMGTSLTIRMKPSKNNQKINIHNYEDYLSFEKAYIP